MATLTLFMKALIQFNFSKREVKGKEYAMIKKGFSFESLITISDKINSKLRVSLYYYYLLLLPSFLNNNTTSSNIFYFHGLIVNNT